MTTRPTGVQQPSSEEWRRYRRTLRWRIVLIVVVLAVIVIAGEFDALPSEQAAEELPTPMAGTGEANGRWVLFTSTPVGRDANAILSCGDPEFPLTPGGA